MSYDRVTEINNHMTNETVMFLFTQIERQPYQNGSLRQS